MRTLYEGRTREEAAPDGLRFQQESLRWAGGRGATVTELRRLLESKVGV